MSENLTTGRVAEPPQPSEVEVVQALGEIEQATKNTVAQSGGPPLIPPPQQSWPSRNAPLLAFLALTLSMIVLLAWGVPQAIKRLLASASGQIDGSGAVATAPAIDPGRQAKAEELLGRVAAGDLAATNEVLDQSDGWTGKTHRTPKTDQLVTTAMNLSDMQARAAAIQAQLALDGVPRDENGLTILKEAVGNPVRRSWALWMLGALGNRGVDPVHTAKIIEGYLNDPDASVRANAVEGLALLATDETIPMLLDRFRNDPSAAVQEPAACAMAESGMYTHQQRMVAAASMVGWLDDSLLTQQQRTWTIQALHDISGQNFGGDSAAWRRWYDSSR
jgi:HEAT repeat protein